MQTFLESLEERVASLEARLRGFNNSDKEYEEKVAKIRAEYPQFSAGNLQLVPGRGRPGTLDGHILLVNSSRTVRATFDFETLTFKLLTDAALIEMLDRIDALDRRGE